MATLMSEATRERILTVRWNNRLTALLGLPMVLFAVIALTSDSISDLGAFIGLVILGSFY